MGVLNFGNEPRLKSENSACGPSVRSRRRGAFGGTTRGLRAAQGKPSPTRLSPWPPRFPGPLGHPPRPSPSLVEVWHFFYGGTCAKNWLTDPRCQNSGFLRSGGIKGSMGPERCGSGVPNGPFGWPIAGLVEGHTFIQTPLLGYGGCSKTP